MQESIDPKNPIVPTASGDAPSMGDPAVGNHLPSQTSVHAPTDDAPTEDAPTEDAPTEDAPTEDAPTEDAPAEDVDLSNEGVDDIADPFDEIDANDDVQPIEEENSEDKEAKDEHRWYILKVQSNREKSICDALARRVKVEGLDRFFGEIMVPTEDVAEYKNGKRKIVKRKLYPGYIVANMALNEDTWFLVRETPGIGDFTGAAGKPTPMLQEEVERIVESVSPDEEDSEAIKTAIPFKTGDRVRIKDGTFGNFEGDVDSIDEANGRITVMINIFGRSTPVELEHWQVESI